MGRPCSTTLTPSWLYQKYCVEGLGILAIARLIGCRNGRVLDMLREHGWLRPKSYVTKAWLTELYVTQRHTIDEIAALMDRDEATVRRYLRKFDIPIRYRSRGREQVPQLNDRAWLLDQYVTHHKSMPRISYELRCNISSVARAFRRLNIVGRDKNDYDRHGPRNPKHAAYRHEFTERRKRLILERDGWHCQMPGCVVTEANEPLQVHHIIPLALGGNNALGNGIALCGACHVRTYGCEASYALIFWNILAAHQEPPA